MQSSLWYHLKSWICAQSLCFNNCETPCTLILPQEKSAETARQRQSLKAGERWAMQ